MTLSIAKGLALCGVCALLAGLGTAASAQGYGDHGPDHHGPMHHARQAVLRQKADYARAVAGGHYGAAERAHLRAQAIRHHVRTRHMMEQGGGGDHRDQGDNRDRGFGQDHNPDH